MKYYFAPMEGITGYVYRNVAKEFFPGVDKYFAPFIQPNTRKVFVPKEERDILPENNQGIPLVPQLLTCNPEEMVRGIKKLEEYGYQEINLNVGCPSGTVVSKGKGAGMLKEPEQLKKFLDEVFAYSFHAKISIKTRLGIENTDDFLEYLDIYNQYPLMELIIHPRYRKDFYQGKPRLEQYQAACGHTSLTLCYNGDVNSVQDALYIADTYPETKGIMCGRGLLANPGLIRQLRGGAALTKEEFKAFHQEVFRAYQLKDFGERNTLFKMKELWNYWGLIFTNQPECVKKLRKAEHYNEYKAEVARILREEEIILPTNLGINAE